jgi:hypothetical protein
MSTTCEILFRTSTEMGIKVLLVDLRTLTTMKSPLTILGKLVSSVVVLHDVPVPGTGGITGMTLRTGIERGWPGAVMAHRLPTLEDVLWYVSVLTHASSFFLTHVFVCYDIRSIYVTQH